MGFYAESGNTWVISAYVLANPGTTLLLDEPDAHLEVWTPAGNL